MPNCKVHRDTKLVCPRCIASRGGKKTAANNPGKASEWGKQGGRGNKKYVPQYPDQAGGE